MASSSGSGFDSLPPEFRTTHGEYTTPYVGHALLGGDRIVGALFNMAAGSDGIAMLTDIRAEDSVPCLVAPAMYRYSLEGLPGSRDIANGLAAGVRREIGGQVLSAQLESIILMQEPDRDPRTVRTRIARGQQAWLVHLAAQAHIADKLPRTAVPLERRLRPNVLVAEIAHSVPKEKIDIFMRIARLLRSEGLLELAAPAVFLAPGR